MDLIHRRRKEKRGKVHERQDPFAVGFNLGPILSRRRGGNRKGEKSETHFQYALGEERGEKAERKGPKLD